MHFTWEENGLRIGTGTITAAELTKNSSLHHGKRGTGEVLLQKNGALKKCGVDFAILVQKKPGSLLLPGETKGNSAGPVSDGAQTPGSSRQGGQEEQTHL